MTMAQGKATFRRTARVLVPMVLAAAVAAVVARHAPSARGARVEAPIIPTVHPTMMPTSALPLPLQIHADEAATWVQNNEQRLFLRGHVQIALAYRTLQANEAALWLTPVRESGENANDVAIYLHGGVRVIESDLRHSTTQTTDELLVTSRIGNDIRLLGTVPVSRIDRDNPVVARGETLRTELLTKPAAPAYLPTIVLQPTEVALQRGWIARGPGNRIISGPGDVAMTVEGIKPVGALPPPAAPKPKPSIFATGDRIEVKELNGERVTTVRGAFYLMYHPADGKAPYEFRAQKAVLFSADTKTPATNPQDQTERLAKGVTGAYLEGDVTVDVDRAQIHAERLYFDFTSNRAIMLDAVLATEDEKRQVPLYMRASEIRILARGEYAAKSVKFSTSEFYQPHYHIGASNVYLQDVTPQDDAGKPSGPLVYEFKAQDTTLNVRGVPIFYWPKLSGDTSESDIPLRRLRIGNSAEYGFGIQTDWDVFSLIGQRPPPGIHANLTLDYFTKRGPQGGVASDYDLENMFGLFRVYGMEDKGVDRLGSQRTDVPVPRNERGRLLERHRQELDDKWTLQLELAYVSDVNYLEQFFQNEFAADKGQETSIYLKRQEGTEAFSILGQWSLFDFITNADLLRDEYMTEKSPEVKYWRIGDSLLDTFTYYSETGAANVMDMMSNGTPAVSALPLNYLQVRVPTGSPGMGPNQLFRDYLQSLGWTNQSVLRGDTRQEIDMPLAVGDAKVVPYVTGRATAWDQAFPEGASGDTTRLWGAAGLRANTQFWQVYDDVNSEFMDVHRMRHIIEPEFNVFVVGTDKNRNQLQPFDEDMRDVEEISDSSAFLLALHQRWQTKRGGPGHWRNVDYLAWNVSYQGFWHKPATGPFAMQDPLRGVYFASRPDLSLPTNSLNTDVTWRVGEFVRVLVDASYNTDLSRLVTASSGLVVDQSPSLSYFIGNRYINAPDPGQTVLSTDELTVAVIYQLTRKYTVMATESYDLDLKHDVISSLSLTRKLPRFNASLTFSYNADMGDTTVGFALWPEGMPQMGTGNTGMLGRQPGQ